MHAMFHDKLLRLSRINGESRRSLSVAVGDVSPATVQRWIEGASFPDVRQLERIARYFKVSTDSLVFDEVDEPEEPLSEDERELVGLIRFLRLDPKDVRRSLAAELARSDDLPVKAKPPRYVKGEPEEPKPVAMPQWKRKPPK